MLTSMPGKFIFGLIVVGGFYHRRRAVLPLADDCRLQEDLVLAAIAAVSEERVRSRRFWRGPVCLQYLTFQFFAVSVLLALPVKLILRLALTIKYVWVTPGSTYE